MSNIYFNKLENVQNVDKVVSIFSRNNPPYKLKPNPLFVLLVGSPGVGKTTKAREFLQRELSVAYDDFYNISLDSLVERIRPYRAATKRLHNTIKSVSIKNNNLTNENYSILSEAYLPTIMSKESNFKLPATVNSISKKIRGEPKNMTRSKKSAAKAAEEALKNLNDMRKEGFIEGVRNGFNILYDTTLVQTKDKLKQDIMPVLEINKDVKYKIVVILVKAPKNVIHSRLQKRHKEMLAEENSYIRAVNPKMINKFIEDNEKGFELAKRYFSDGTYEKNTITFYDKNDFSFIEVDNL